MIKCSKCGKELKNENQSHYCAKVSTIDEYIENQTSEVKEILLEVRSVIRKAAPDAEERMSWQMPTFWQGENLIHFCAHKKHFGIYPGALENLPFTEKLSKYKTSKGAIQFPYDKPIDYELISDITKYRVSCVENKESK